MKLGVLSTDDALAFELTLGPVRSTENLDVVLVLELVTALLATTPSEGVNAKICSKIGRAHV